MNRHGRIWSLPWEQTAAYTRVNRLVHTGASPNRGTSSLGQPIATAATCLP